MPGPITRKELIPTHIGKQTLAKPFSKRFFAKPALARKIGTKPETAQSASRFDLIHRNSRRA
jgi:hypothetical protein